MKVKSKTRIFLVSVSMGVIFLTGLTARSVQAQISTHLDVTPTNCEMALMYYDESMLEVKSRSNLLIFIAHPGEKELSKPMIRSRLRSFKKKLVVPGIFAIGDKTNGLGTVEMYANGLLFRTIYYKANVISPCTLKDI